MLEIISLFLRLSNAFPRSISLLKFNKESIKLLLNFPPLCVYVKDDNLLEKILKILILKFGEKKSFRLDFEF